MVKKFKQFLNESKEQKPYNVKFKKQIDEINALIEKAKEDDVYAIEPDSTQESNYIFDKVEIDGNIFKVYYEEYSGKMENVIDEIDLSTDYDFEDFRRTLSWIKRSIKKGYREKPNDN